MATSLKSLAQIIADCAKVISRVSAVETNMVKKTDFGTNFDTQKKILMGFSISGNKLYYKPSESGTATRLADYSEIPTQAQIEGWIDAKGYLTSTDIADFKNETQIRSIITGYNYLTASSIANFKTEAQIKSLIEGYGYATTSQLSGYLTSSDISGFKTEAQIKSIIEGYGYLASADLSGYATEAFVTGKGYLTESGVNTLLGTKGYLTAANLSGYVKTSDLSTYLTSADIADFVTESEVNTLLGTKGYLTSSSLTGYAKTADLNLKGLSHEDAPSNWATLKLLTVSNGVLYYNGTAISNPTTGSEFANEAILASIFSTNATTGIANGLQLWHKKSDGTFARLAYASEITGMALESVPSNWEDLKKLSVSSGVLYYNNVAIAGGTSGDTPTFANEEILAALYASNSGTQTNGTQLWHKKSDNTYARLVYASEIANFLTESGVNTLLGTKGYLTSSDIAGFKTETQIKSIIESYSYLTSSAISGFKTESQIKSIIEGYGYLASADLTDYATKTYVTGLGYLTESDVDTLLGTKGYLTSANLSAYLTSSSSLNAAKLTGTIPASCYTDTDTKNTAGSTAMTRSATAKYYLIGAGSQDANPQTYSDSKCYVLNGELYSNEGRVALASELSGFKTEDQIKSIIEGYGYLTSASFSSDYATKTYVTGLGYITESEVETLLGTKSYLTASSSLDATKLTGTVPSTCYTDTKNTTGSSAISSTTSKYYLIGAASQAANCQTFSNGNCYILNGILYSGDAKVATESYVTGLGYVTSSALSGYVKSTSLGGMAYVSKPTWWDSAGTNLGKAHSHAAGVLADVAKPSNWDAIFGQQYFLTAEAGAMAYLSKPTWWDSMTATVVSNSHTHASGVLANVTKPEWFDNMTAGVISNSHTHSKEENEVSSLTGTSVVVASNLTDAVNYRYDVYLTSTTKTVPNPMVNIAASAGDTPVYVPASSLLYLDTNNTRLCMKVPLEWLDVIGDTSTSYTIKVRRYKL